MQEQGWRNVTQKGKRTARLFAISPDTTVGVLGYQNAAKCEDDGDEIMVG